MDCNNPSQRCGRLYFPMFLFNVGLLTLMYMASFIALAMLWSSLPIILKFFTDVMWPVLFWCSCIGDGAFRCFFEQKHWEIQPATPVGWVITIHPRTKNKQIMTLHYNICAIRVIMPSTITSVHMGQFTKQHSLHHNIYANKKKEHNENKINNKIRY